MRLRFFILFIILFPLLGNAQQYSWNSVRISGGGNVTSIIFHPLVKDVIYITTDVGTPWRWNSKEEKWEDMMLGSKIPVNYWTKELSQAASNLAIDPNDKSGNIVYATVENGNPITFRKGMGKGGVLKSYDRGKTWVDCWLPITVLPNSNHADKEFINRIVVDPNNSNIIYVLSHENGTWINEHAGKKGFWKKVNTGLPDKNFHYIDGKKRPINNARFILPDPSSGIVNKRTKTIYIAYLNGVLRSNDGGKTFKHMDNSPQAGLRRGTISKEGILFVSYNLSAYTNTPIHHSGIMKWDKTKWTDVTPEPLKYKGQYYNAVDANPTNGNEVLVSQRGTWNKDKFFRSKDGGKTWESPDFKIDNTEAPHSGTGNPAYDNNAFGWDPFRAGEVWYVDMIDVGHTKNIWADTVQWKLQDKGLEEVIVTGPLLAPPFGKNLLHSSTADIGGADHRSLTDILPYGMTKFFFGEVETGTNIVHTAIQYNNPDFIVRIGSDGWGQLNTESSRAGYSLDGGETYQPFPSSPGVRGRVAVSANSQNIVWITQANGKANGEVFWSHDLGKTWTKSKGTPSGIIPYGWQWNVPAGNNYLVADKVDGRTFYIFDRGSFYISTDSGVSFTKINTSLPNSGINIKNNKSAIAAYTNIETAPDKKGNIWIAYQDSLKGGLYHSNNGGKTFVKIRPDILKRPMWIAIGKDKPNGKNILYTTSNIYAIEKIKYGVFRSDDEGRTWKIIANPAPGVIKNLAADYHGRVFAGINGVGIFYGEPIKNKLINK